jgi:hypothetical protein
MNGLHNLWLKYNEYSNELSLALGRTNNIVGEYGEYLANQYYKGEILSVSNASADIKTSNGKYYQIKSRKVKRGSTGQLSVIRTWNFDFLVVIIFDNYGIIKFAIEMPSDVAKEYAVHNKHQNGDIITTTNNFLNDSRCKDIKLFLNKCI